MRSLSPLLATLVIISLNPFFAKVYANPKKPKTTSKAVSSLDRLAARCEKAKATFHPLGKKDVDRALGRLIEAADRLEERLALDGSNGKAWKKYLQWAKLQSQLDSEEPDAKVLQDIYTRFVRQYEGLELVWFLDLRDALAHYLAVAGAVDNPNLETFYQEQLDRLADAIRAYAEKPTGEQAQTIGRLLGWLENARQADALVAAVRRVFHRPNLRIMATEELVGAGISEPVDEETPIEDCILRTTLVGTGQTNGEITTELVPNKKEAIVDIIVVSTTDSNNIGYHGPVRIFSNGLTRIGARKRVFIHADGIEALPAVSDAETDTTITGLCSVRNSRLVERVAWKRVYKQKGLAECIASLHAEERMNRRVDRRAGEPLQQADEAYENRFRKPLFRRRLFPEDLRFSTTEDTLRVRALQTGSAQLAAPDEPPALVKGASLGVQIHESMINNTATSALAGRELDEARFLATLEDLFGEVPERLRSDQEEQMEPWGITFAASRPFTMDFRQGAVTLTLRARRYARGEKQHPGMHVSTTYRIEKADGRIRLVRDGELKIHPPEVEGGKPRRLSARETTIKTLLQRRFEKIFEPEIVPRVLTLPGRWERAGEMTLIQMDSANGWLVAAYKPLAPKPTTTLAVSR